MKVNTRQTSGATLVEMLISVLVMSIASVAIFGLLITSMSTSKKLNNKLDSIDFARQAMDKISRDVRMARNLGDVHGTTINVNGQIFLEGTQLFPSNRNPLYGAGQSPPAGWPDGAWPFRTGGNPPAYDMNGANPGPGRLLVVQIPIFDPDGFPSVIPPGTGNPAQPQAQPNSETHIYALVQDPDQLNHPGEWLLQWVKIPGMATAGYNPMTVRPNTPQTIASGIVGPLDGAGRPQVFQFVNRFDGLAHSGIGTCHMGDPTPAQISAYSGVVVSMEIVQHNETSRINNRYKTPGLTVIRQEVFVRNNAQASFVGMPI